MCDAASRSPEETPGGLDAGGAGVTVAICLCWHSMDAGLGESDGCDLTGSWSLGG